jgi:hypothetical protein
MAVFVGPLRWGHRVVARPLIGGLRIVRGAAAAHHHRCMAAMPDRAAQTLRQGHSEWRLGTPILPELKRDDDGLAADLQRRVTEVPRMLLPRGYPHTVAPGYLGYTSWLAVGLFAHSLTVMVSTNALLSGFFAEMSAASWLMKDLLPPLVAGTLASRIRTLEANPKRWLGAACACDHGRARWVEKVLGGTGVR